MAGERERAVGALLGLAIGDAVGSTLEFEIRDALPPITDMVGGGPFRLTSGQWTDDTSMALCLADTLIAGRGKIDARHLLTGFCNWWQYGWNSVTGECFDIGTATQSALRAFLESGSLVNNVEEHLQANGSIMRLAPVVICANSREEVQRLALEQGQTTHAAAVPQQCCRELAGHLWDAIVLGDMPMEVRVRGALRRDKVISSGHAPATLTAACWAVASTQDFEAAILAAANLAGDSDTVAAVTGQIAGAIYGIEGIPDRWLSRLAWREKIESKASQLWALRQRAPA